MSTPFVRAVLVTDGRTDYIPTALAAIAASDYPPSQFHLVLVDGAGPSDLFGLDVDVFTSSASTYAAAIDEVLEAQSARDGELLWLLHDDVAPAPDALGRLVATMGKRPRAAIVGAAHVRWRDTSRLVNLGTTVSRIGARRIPLVVEDDINQGQHDWREDVMAVSLAAALIRREAFERLGGIDSGYDGFGDSLEFCRRAWASGLDVVVDPSALVRHAQASLYGARSAGRGRASTHARRRVSDWHHAFAWAPWWLVPVLVILVPLSAVVRVPVRIAQNVPRVALAELAVPALLVRRLPAIARTVAAHRRAGARGAIEPRLFASPKLVMDAVRQRELGVFERSRAANVPSDLLRAELDSSRATHRLSLLFVAIVATGAAVALGIGWIRALAGGQMITGPGIGSTALSSGAVWSRAWTGWSDTGFGSPGIDGAFAGLMAPLAALPGGLRVSLGVFLIAAPLIAALAAWRAAGHATRGSWMRGSAALVFALWPPFLAAIFDGRVGPVIAHIALAIAADAFARATGWRRGELVRDREVLDSAPASASAGLATALALTVATVAQPVLLIPVIVVIVVLGAAASSSRRRLGGMISVPVVVGLPGLVAAARYVSHPTDALSILAREPGPGASWQGDAWRVAMGLSDTGRWAPLIHGAGVIGRVGACVLIVAALAALLSRSAWRSAAVGLALVGIGFGVSWWSASSTVAWSDNAGAGAISGWPGAGSSLVVLGALVAALSTDGALRGLIGRRFAVGRVVGASLATLAVGASLATVVFMAWPGAVRGSATVAASTVLPLAVPLDQEGPYRQRVLVLDQRDDGTIAYTVLSHDGSSEAIGRTDLGPTGEPLGTSGEASAAVSSIAETVADASRSGEAKLDALTAWGIGAIVVTPGGDRIRSALDQNGSLTLAGDSERGTAYRIEGGTASRAWVETNGSKVALRSTATEGSLSQDFATGGTLVIAVPAGKGWQAWAEGSALKPVNDALGRAAFAVPAGASNVSYAYRDPAQRWWWWASAVAVAWALLGAVPLRRSSEVAA
ncbi:glycosyltransferase family 2 protein [Demequina lutea]|uniref:Glycosyltransferase, GT2 family n=1 Tax=Demequina lutea TaxID=431489 RepID=A0A7Z0CHF1_9MICO|nr:glycosyltransferase [Demequina lutea]NYI40784.1 hypothetical protein [Demequina lutea]